MRHSLKHTTFIFMVLLTLILSYVPKPVSSSPIVVLQDHSHAYNTFHVDNKLAFDVSFAFGTPKRCAQSLIHSVRSDVVSSTTHRIERHLRFDRFPDDN